MLAPHIQSWQPGILGWAIRCRPLWLKCLHADAGSLGEIKRQFPDCQTWFRHWFAEQDQRLDDPPRRAIEALQAVLADLDNAQCRQHVDWISSYNETGLFADAERYRDFETVFTEQAHREGLKVVSYNFSVGQPPLDDWDRYTPVSGDALGLNQYHAPSMDSPGAEWTLLRHVKVRARTGYTGPILIGETGVDWGVLGQQLDGWRKGSAVEEYVRQLRWAAEQFRQTGVTAAFLFNAGGWGWESFEVGNVPEIADCLAELADAERARPAPPSPTAPPAAPVGPSFRLGFADYVRSHPEIAVPLEEERPDWAGNAYQRFRDRAGGEGILRWEKATNRITEYARVRQS